MGFIIGTIVAICSIFAGGVLLLGGLWLLVHWQFWAVLFCIALVGNISRVRREHRAKKLVHH